MHARGEVDDLQAHSSHNLLTAIRGLLPVFVHPLTLYRSAKQDRLGTGNGLRQDSVVLVED